MKQLDRFYRLENVVLHILGYFTVFGGASLLVIFFADAFFLKELSPFIRYPIWVALGIVGAILGLAVTGSVELFFAGIRKTLRMKPIEKIDAEIDAQRAEAEFTANERELRWFTELPDSMQRYRLYLLQQRQIVLLNDIYGCIKIIMVILIGVLVSYVGSRYGWR